MSTYDKVVADVAVDLALNEPTLREAFSVWVNTPGTMHPSLPHELNAACYAVYRLVKAHDAFRMTSRSRCGWRDVALSRGANLRLDANEGYQSPVIDHSDAR